MRPLALLVVSLLTALGLSAADPTPAPPPPPVQHPALFLVGDSTVRTGQGNGDVGQWGWGSEIGAFLDPAVIHLYNEARGGRSSRSFIAEGHWEKIRAQLQPGDFVIVQFGHNDNSNSANSPDRATISGAGDETLVVGIGPAQKTIRTYGAYLRQYIRDIQAAGATAIVCSPVPRNQWDHGKIRRGFDGYAAWAAATARADGALFLDLNTLAADRYDALGETSARTLFVDHQHTNKAGARLHAACVAAGLAQLPGHPLAKALRSPSP